MVVTFRIVHMQTDVFIYLFIYYYSTIGGYPVFSF